MRFPVFARRSNPSIDRPILRKSMQYNEGQVALGLADWVDSVDRRQGIIAREMLYFGERQFKREIVTLSSALPLAELHGVKFSPRQMNREMAAVSHGLIAKAQMWAKAATIAQ